ncbi:MAG: DUF1269 domain-containing protein [Ilumatobacteraceae bacterium]
MSDQPESHDTIVGISFDDAFRAQELMTAAFRLASKGQAQVLDAVTIVKDASGKTYVKETIDPSPGQSALSGSVWTGLLGLLLGGPVGWLAGAAIGAGAGAARAKIVDLGVPDEWVAWFREAVQPGTVTLVLLLGRFDREATFTELARFGGGHLVHANLPPDAVARIRAALDDTAPVLPEPAPVTDATE